MVHHTARRTIIVRAMLPLLLLETTVTNILLTVVHLVALPVPIHSTHLIPPLVDLLLAPVVLPDTRDTPKCTKHGSTELSHLEHAGFSPRDMDICL